MKAHLGVGPMSSEVVEAAFRYSHFYRKELMLIASKNQVDYRGGYVNNWTTRDFMSTVQGLRRMYPQSLVAICRDHCGPGFNGVSDLQDTYRTIEDDIANGFDLIHIDFCHFKGTNVERLKQSQRAIEYCLRLNPRIRLEIGTDENQGTSYHLPVLGELEREIDYFASFCNPEFYVVQTGSLVKELRQVGSFNATFVRSVSRLIKKRGLKLKEHNADYLSRQDIAQRKDLVDAMNIAPQLGVIQTQIVLGKCLTYGVRFDHFLNEVYSTKKWKKWLHGNTASNRFLCATIAGHYRFASGTFRKIMETLASHEDIHETIMNQIVETIHHYER